MLAMKNKQEQLVCADLFQDQQVLVLGLGKTGVSCARFLAARNVDFSIMDSRQNPPGIESLNQSLSPVKCYFGQFDLNVAKDYDVFIVSPGISINEPIVNNAIENNKQVVGDVELFALCTLKPVIAITGSNGKSTVTALLGEMATQAKISVAVGGNIGVPVLDLLADDAETELYILELSSFQLETTHSLNAVVSTILNVSEDHMDRYDSFSEYKIAKQKIYQGDGVVIINKDEQQVIPVNKDRTINYFSLQTPVSENEFGLICEDGQTWLAKGNDRLTTVSSLKIKGQHNIANALAALALGDSVNIPMPAMINTLKKFTGLPHRSQWVLEHNGVNWINDSKATNVGAALAAINGLGNNKPGLDLIVLLGGQGKGQDFSPLEPALISFSRLVLIYGEDAQLIKETLGKKIKTKIVGNLAVAVTEAKNISKPGDTVLLSPACASFDMFSGFEHRGDEFIRLVHEVTS